MVQENDTEIVKASIWWYSEANLFTKLHQKRCKMPKKSSFLRKLTGLMPKFQTDYSHFQI